MECLNYLIVYVIINHVRYLSGASDEAFATYSSVVLAVRTFEDEIRGLRIPIPAGT
jgi:hypothetical protein